MLCLIFSGYKKTALEKETWLSFLILGYPFSKVWYQHKNLIYLKTDNTQQKKANIDLALDSEFTPMTIQWESPLKPWISYASENSFPQSHFPLIEATLEIIQYKSFSTYFK